MKREGESLVEQPKHRRLIKVGDTYYVPISHLELDHLVGRLMQMCDLTADPEQRKALKDETKQRVRAWLNDEYSMNGYHQWDGVREDAVVTEIE